jgi:hypothetical protein
MNITCKNPLCNRSFPSGFTGTDSSNITFKNFSTQCPYCGTMNTINGTYDFDKSGKATLISKLKKLSNNQLKSVLYLSKEAQNGNLDEGSFTVEINKLGINPNFVLDQEAVNNLGFKAFILTLIAILYMLLPKEKNQDITSIFNQIQKPNTTIINLQSETEKHTVRIYPEADTALHNARRAMNNFNRKKNKGK